MRNLKKILALVLALIMSLSLMATAGAGSFQDVTDDNPYKTAIDVLDELKVFQGFEDGSFKPTDTLNRAQAAVLVYRIATGDVENKYLDNYTYMAQSKFNDLEGYNWAKGYINYCQNAGIVVGTSATTFNPGAPVTGYQLLVMVLRTLGYGKAGEFTDPKGWELQTASIAEREGILKNVTGGDFGAPAPRQMVAEILFRGLLHDTVQYSPLTPNGYTESGEILGKRVGLEEITGVVVANEIAALDDTKPAAEGKTRMIVDEKTRTLDVSTDASAIGLTYHAYVKGETVLADLEEAGNTVGEPENGAGTKVSDLLRANGLKTDASTEYYVDFSPVVKDTSDWRLEYVITKDMTEYDAYRLVQTNKGYAWRDTNENGKVDAGETKIVDIKATDDISAKDDTVKVTYTYNKVIPVGNKITSQDHTYIRDIFHGSDNKDGVIAADDNYWGEVYVATRSGKNTQTDTSYDISDELSYKEFYEKYIDPDTNATFDNSDNGEWLRVIDNDGDGMADYILLTQFTMTVVTDYESRTDVYTVEWDEDPTDRVTGTEIKAGDMVKAEGTELSVGSVVLYAKIDGVYYICNPVVDVKAIDKKSINAKAETFTADGQAYTWSEIERAATGYYDDILDVTSEVTYNLYLDHFGYVRLATETSKGFALLTDAYFYTDYRNPEYKADLYVGNEFVEETPVVDAARNTVSGVTYDGFVDTDEGDHGNRGTWKRLNTYGEYYNLVREYNANAIYTNYVDKSLAVGSAGMGTFNFRDPFYTNVAAFTAEEGTYTLYDVNDISRENGLQKPYHTYEIAGTKMGDVKGTNATKDDTLLTPAANESGLSHIKAGSVKAKNEVLYGITQWVNGTHLHDADLQRINTNGSTTYYVVANPGTTKQAVTSWVGYQNVPEELGNFTAMRAYAVTHSVAGTDYEVADVVVFEGIYEKTVNEAWLVVNALSTKREESLGRREDNTYGDEETSLGVFTADQMKSADDPNGLRAPQVAFWAVGSDGKPVEVTKDFADYGIYAGTVVTDPETRRDNYIQISLDGKSEKLTRDFKTFYTDKIETYELEQDTDYGGDARRNLKWTQKTGTDRIQLGDDLIVMCDADGVVQMAINVSKSTVDGDSRKDIAKLVALHEDIVDDYGAAKASTATIVVDKIKGVDVVNGEVHLTYTQGTSNQIVNYAARVVGNENAPTTGISAVMELAAKKVNVQAPDGAKQDLRYLYADGSADDISKNVSFTILFTAYVDGKEISQRVTVFIDAANDDMGIQAKNILVKGKPVNVSKQTGIDFEVALTVAEAKNSEKFIVATPDYKDATVTLNAPGVTGPTTLDATTAITAGGTADIFVVAEGGGATRQQGYKIAITIGTASAEPTLEAVATKSGLTGTTLYVPAGVSVTQSNYETYLKVADAVKATTAVTVSGKDITLENKEDGKDATTKKYTWENEVVDLAAEDIDDIVKADLGSSFAAGGSDAAKITLAGDLAILVDPTSVYDLTVGASSKFKLVSTLATPLTEIAELKVDWAWKDADKHPNNNGEVVGLGDVNTTTTENVLVVTFSAYDADGVLLDTLVINPELKKA